MKIQSILMVLVAVVSFIFPDFVFASGGITEFSSPLEKIVGTITGPMGKYISIAGIALAGVMYLINKEDLSGSMKGLITTVVSISIIAGSSSIVTTLFSFSGAVV